MNMRKRNINMLTLMLEIIEHMAAMSNVLDRMEEPPHTRAAYHDKPGGMMSIVEMEYRELMECKKEAAERSTVRLVPFCPWMV